MSSIGAIVYRDYRQRRTNIGFMFWDIGVPLLYLALFGTGFDRMLPSSIELGGRPVNYIAFLLPGVIAMTGFSVAMNTAWGFFMDKDSGIFYELLTYPITRQQLLIGRGCFNILLSLAGTVLAVLLGAWMGVPVRWDLMPVTLLAAAVTTAGWFFLLSILAIQLNRMDSFNTLTSAAYIFFMFLSPLFYPLPDLPAWFQWAAFINPMTWQVDLLRFSLLGAGHPGVLVAEAAAFTVFTGINLALAVRALNRAV